jgi:hypothetical protein
MLFEVVNTMPPRPGAFAELPRELELALAIGLAKNRDERFASAEAFSAAFVAAAHGKMDAALKERAEALLRTQPWAD